MYLNMSFSLSVLLFINRYMVVAYPLVFVPFFHHCILNRSCCVRHGSWKNEKLGVYFSSGFEEKEIQISYYVNFTDTYLSVVVTGHGTTANSVNCLENRRRTNALMLFITAFDNMN